MDVAQLAPDVDSHSSRSGVRLTVELTAELRRQAPPERYVRPFAGCVTADDPAAPIGRISGYRLNVARAQLDGRRLDEAALTQGPAAVAFAAAVDELPASSRFADVLAVADVFLEPAWRGRELGLDVVRQTVELLGSCCPTILLTPTGDRGGALSGYWHRMSFEAGPRGTLRLQRST